MMQMLMSMFQNQMPQGGYGQQMNAQAMSDWFADCMEQYCEDVIERRRRMPRKFKQMLKTAWSGAKHAVSERYGDDDDDDDDDERYGQHRRGGNRYGSSSDSDDFWNKLGKLHAHKNNLTTLNTEMMRHFPNASPEEVAVLRKMAMEYDEGTRRTLSKLMNHGN